MKTWLAPLGTLSAIVLIGGLLITQMQAKLIFFPTPLSKNYEYKFNHEFEEEFIEVSRGVSLNALHFKSKKSKDVVLYFHGNAGNLESWGHVFEDFKRLNTNLFIIDYRGYGKSDGGISSESEMYQDAKKVFEKVAADYGKEKVILYGRSIGTGIASYLATLFNPKALILETPYYSLVDLAKKVYPFVPSSIIAFKFPNNEYLGKVKVPTYLIHGTNDEIIPHDSSIRLNREHPKAKLFTVPGGYHNNLSQYEEFHQALTEIFSELN